MPTAAWCTRSPPRRPTRRTSSRLPTCCMARNSTWADSGYRGAASRVDRDGLQWHIAARPSDIAKLPEGRKTAAVKKREHRKASVRAKVEHPFRVIKRQFGLVKVRFRGLAKNTAHVITLFALSNLWMARRQLMAIGAVRPPSA